MPSRDAQHLFEMLVLEGAQAGLSWITILRKREAYRRAFDGFDPEKMALLLAGPGPPASRRPIHRQEPAEDRGRRPQRAGVSGAARRHDDVVAWFWQFVGGRPKLKRWTRMRPGTGAHRRSRTP